MEEFLIISTDKAVNPSSVMGATKRVAEYIIRQYNEQGKTRLMAVRFGNVLGSAGSVISIFKEQIRTSGPVTVTHPEMKRFFMTVQEAVSLCLLTIVRPLGNLCILDMGEQIRISELAEQLIVLAGFVPGKDIEIRFSGLRPGEKLCEELMTEMEGDTRKVHEKILVADASSIPPMLDAGLDKLETSVTIGAPTDCLTALHELVPTYNTQNGRCLSAPPALFNATSGQRDVNVSSTLIERASFHIGNRDSHTYPVFSIQRLQTVLMHRHWIPGSQREADTQRLAFCCTDRGVSTHR